MSLRMRARMRQMRWPLTLLEVAFGLGMLMVYAASSVVGEYLLRTWDWCDKKAQHIVREPSPQVLYSFCLLIIDPLPQVLFILFIRP